MLTGVVHHSNALRPQHTGHHRPHRHHVIIVIGRAPVIPVVVAVAVIGCEALGRVGVVDQHLRLRSVGECRDSRRLKQPFDFLARQLGVIPQPVIPDWNRRTGCRAGKILLKHRTAVLLRDVGGNIGQRLRPFRQPAGPQIRFLPGFGRGDG